jgi:hypothetical protein
MKRLVLLKTLVSIFFMVCMVCLTLGLPFIITLAVFPEKVPFKLGGLAVADVHAEEILLLLAEYTSCAFYVYALYLFKQTLVLFEKKKIFSFEVVKLLDQTGRAIIVGCIIGYVSGFMYGTLVQGTFEVGITVGFGSTLFILGLGLFFIVLGDVFGTAKQLKEENDLTI